jgi:hypothetical protein
MSIQEVIQTLGQPKSTQTRTNGTTHYRWYEYFTQPNGQANVHRDQGGLYADATALGVVYQVGVFSSSKYATVEGLHVGLSRDVALKIMGQPTYRHTWPSAIQTTEEYVYRETGISFYVDETPKHEYFGQVLQIYIFAKQTP